ESGPPPARVLAPQPPSAGRSGWFWVPGCFLSLEATHPPRGDRAWPRGSANRCGWCYLAAPGPPSSPPKSASQAGQLASLQPATAALRKAPRRGPRRPPKLESGERNSSRRASFPLSWKLLGKVRWPLHMSANGLFHLDVVPVERLPQREVEID